MKKSHLVVAMVLLVVTTATAQKKANAAAEEKTRFDFALSFAAVFSKTVSSSNGLVTDDPTTSGEVLGTVRYHINGLNAVELNLGHTSNSQIFTVPPDTYRIVTDIFEYSGDYVLTPFTGKKLQPFLFAGVGALRFTPGNTYIDSIQGLFGTGKQTSLAFLYGGGADYAFFQHLALRLQYRGLVYKNPDFLATSRFYTGAKGHMAEPAVGIVVKF